MKLKRLSAGLLSALAFAAAPLWAAPSALFTLSAESKRAASAYAALRAAGSAYSARLASARKSLGAAEDEAAMAWALARARPLEGASPDGSYAGSEAAGAAFQKARDRALAAAREIERRREGSGKSPGPVQAALAELRKRASALSKLFSSGSLSQSAQAYAAAEAELLALSPDLKRLFPEALEAGKALKAAGRTGRRLWLSLLASGDAEEVALSLLSSRKAVVAAAPQAAAALDRLEAVLGAEAALSASSLLFLYPGAEGPERASFAAAARLLLGLGPERSLALLEALDGSAYRLLEEGKGSSRFASLLSRLPEARTRELAADLGLSAGELASLRALAEAASGFSAPRYEAPFARPEPLPGAGPALDGKLRALNAVLAAAAALPEGRARRAAFLPLLERPELMALAASDERYAALYAEAGSAFSSLYAEADAGAAETLSRAPSLARAAARLFPKPASPRLEVAVYELGDLGGSRSLAFAAKVLGPGDKAFLLPIDPSLAGPAYAAAFAEGAGAEGAKAQAALLSRCRVFVYAALPRDGERILLPLPPYPERKGQDRAAAREGAASLLEAELIAGGGI